MSIHADRWHDCHIDRMTGSYVQRQHNLFWGVMETSRIYQKRRISPWTWASFLAYPAVNVRILTWWNLSCLVLILQLADVSVKKIQNYCLRATFCSFEWEHLFGTFLTWFRRKNYLGGLEKRTKQTNKQTKNNRKESITGRKLFTAWRLAGKLKLTLLLGNFTLRSQEMVPNYSLYPYKCLDFHLRKILLQFWANKYLSASDAITLAQVGNMTKRACYWIEP